MHRNEYNNTNKLTSDITTLSKEKTIYHPYDTLKKKKGTYFIF